MHSTKLFFATHRREKVDFDVDAFTLETNNQENENTSEWDTLYVNSHLPPLYFDQYSCE